LATEKAAITKISRIRSRKFHSSRKKMQCLSSHTGFYASNAHFYMICFSHDYHQPHPGYTVPPQGIHGNASSIDLIFKLKNRKFIARAAGVKDWEAIPEGKQMLQFTVTVKIKIAATKSFNCSKRKRSSLFRIQRTALSISTNMHNTAASMKFLLSETRLAGSGSTRPSNTNSKMEK